MPNLGQTQKTAVNQLDTGHAHLGQNLAQTVQSRGGHWGLASL